MVKKNQESFIDIILIYIYIYIVQVEVKTIRVVQYSTRREGRKEGNVLFKDALNTFYLWLYGVRHMVKDHSDRSEETCSHHIGYSFRLAARVLLYASSQTQDSTYHGLCYTSRGALVGTRTRREPNNYDMVLYFVHLVLQ